MKIKKETLDFGLEIKQDDVNDDGTFKGVVSPFGGKADGGGDIVAPGAFTKTIANGGRNGNGIPFLFNHDTDFVLGTWDDFVEKKSGLVASGRFELETQLGKEKHILAKTGAIKGLSIGFNALEFEINEGGRNKPRTRLLKEVELWEVSLVVFPMQTRATVTDVKTILENAKTPRELEYALRDAGLSKSAAQYVVKLSKSNLRDSKEKRTRVWDDVLKEIRDVNILLKQK